MVISIIKNIYNIYGRKNSNGLNQETESVKCDYNSVLKIVRHHEHDWKRFYDNQSMMQVRLKLNLSLKPGITHLKRALVFNSYNIVIFTFCFVVANYLKRIIIVFIQMSERTVKVSQVKVCFRK